MQTTANYGLKKPDGIDLVKISDFNSNFDIIDNEIANVNTSLSESMNVLIPTESSTANAILLNIPNYTNFKKYSFKASADSTGNVTINGKAFKKSNGIQISSGGVKVGKVYDFYYDSVSDCVFILAKAEGDVVATDVLAGKIFSNGDESGLVGTMVNNNVPSTSLAINGNYTIPQGYHPGTEVVTQSITTKAVATITPSTVNQTIPANVYTTGIQTILGDADLIADNIKSGKNIFNVAGTYDPLALIAGTSISLYNDTTMFAITSHVSLGLIEDATCVNHGGTVTVSFSLKTDTNQVPFPYGQIYVNGVARGILRTITVYNTAVVFTENITVNVGDVVAVYAQGYYTTSYHNTVDLFSISCGNTFGKFS